jgi:hypothetical protein
MGVHIFIPRLQHCAQCVTYAGARFWQVEYSQGEFPPRIKISFISYNISVIFVGQLVE